MYRVCYLLVLLNLCNNSYVCINFITFLAWIFYDFIERCFLLIKILCQQLFPYPLSWYLAIKIIGSGVGYLKYLKWGRSAYSEASRLSFFGLLFPLAQQLFSSSLAYCWWCGKYAMGFPLTVENSVWTEWKSFFYLDGKPIDGPPVPPLGVG